MMRFVKIVYASVLVCWLVSLLAIESFNDRQLFMSLMVGAAMFVSTLTLGRS